MEGNENKTKWPGLNDPTYIAATRMNITQTHVDGIMDNSSIGSQEKYEQLEKIREHFIKSGGTEEEWNILQKTEKDEWFRFSDTFAKAAEAIQDEERGIKIDSGVKCPLDEHVQNGIKIDGFYRNVDRARLHDAENLIYKAYVNVGREHAKEYYRSLLLIIQNLPPLEEIISKREKANEYKSKNELRKIEKDIITIYNKHGASIAREEYDNIRKMNPELPTFKSILKKYKQ